MANAPEGKVLCYIDEVLTELEADKTFGEQLHHINIFSDFEPGTYGNDLHNVEAEKPIDGEYYYTNINEYHVDDYEEDDTKCYKPNKTFREQGFTSVYYLMYDEESSNYIWASCIDSMPKEINTDWLVLSTKVVSAQIAYRDDEENVKKVDVILSPYYSWGTQQSVCSEYIESTMYACPDYEESLECPIDNDDELYYGSFYLVKVTIDGGEASVGSVVTFRELEFDEMYKDGNDCLDEYPEDGGTYRTTQGE